ncbi:MAG: hypothetical protein JWN92_803 [Candidatus Acidoferrum typicum]|nr:hypothetical protein [Candidatus Acidoferrum typicum]
MSSIYPHLKWFVARRRRNKFQKECSTINFSVNFSDLMGKASITGSKIKLLAHSVKRASAPA